MQVDWDVPIHMQDGTVLRADVFRPSKPGRYPVILTHGVYGKGLPIERFRHKLSTLADSLPDNVKGADVADAFAPGSDADIADDDFRVWEVVDPADWTPHGYVCVRIDSRGSGASPGRLDPLCTQEIDDYAACIEWAGGQDWSNGRVGLCGKSYYAVTQWLVAARRPKHLAAICVWHGWSDFYRDATRHGGILYQFWEKFWYPQLALPVQNGVGPEAGINPHSGRAIAGEKALDGATLAANRADIVGDISEHRLHDDYYRERTPQLEKIRVPVLASADWSDHDLHLRGTIDGFLQASSGDKWLEVHAGGQFDDPDAVALQRRFMDHHLKNAEPGWRRQPRVQLTIRHADGGVSSLGAEQWPVPGTTWRTYHLDLGTKALAVDRPREVAHSSYAADGGGIGLETAPLDEKATVVGPVSATVWFSSSTADADLFLIVDALDPDGKRVELRDHRGGLTHMTVGWLRASHRAIDPARSRPWQPYQTHERIEALEPGTIYKAEIELRPTSLRLPARYRLRLTVKGNGPAHDDPTDRPKAVFANTVTLHSGPDMPAKLLIPIVPPLP